ncbi:adenylosuccinate lyase [Lentzea kentuckyensis]|uniref:adenylosuccinate lyase n=1 Tax=Lentzea kentuckyensis TaxID=360086 RepID=UPI000A3C54BA|nr:adenylosuccinate lyase [Lentzea kentuckyensis]
MTDPLFALSPVDGRYLDHTSALRDHLSEWALQRNRLLVEVEWLVAMSEEDSLPEMRALTAAETAWLRAIPSEFDAAGGHRVKEIERTTRHDVKAVEMYLRERLEGTSLADLVEWVHFGCTSEDISNLAYARMIRDAVELVWLPAAEELTRHVAALAEEHRALPMAGRTHGQLATPTTLGKELAVFAHRWRRQLRSLRDVEHLGKFGGAVGAFNAHVAAYPAAPWPSIAARFVARLGLVWNPLTTQIESHDWLVELMHALLRFNAVLRDFTGDVWLYLCLGGLRLRPVAGEIGSSTMPHKVNPAAFENAEANVAVSSGMLETLTRELPVSRLQRDLSDSAKLRTFGTALGHSLIAVRAATTGARRLVPDEHGPRRELAGAWELLTEAVQTVMRKHGIADGYQQVKEFCAGGVDRAGLHAFVTSLGLPPEDEKALLALTPSTYVGLADLLVGHLRE